MHVIPISYLYSMLLSLLILCAIWDYHYMGVAMSCSFVPKPNPVAFWQWRWFFFSFLFLNHEKKRRKKEKKKSKHDDPIDNYGEEHPRQMTAPSSVDPPCFLILTANHCIRSHTHPERYSPYPYLSTTKPTTVTERHEVSEEGVDRIIPPPLSSLAPNSCMPEFCGLGITAQSWFDALLGDNFSSMTRFY